MRRDGAHLAKCAQKELDGGNIELATRQAAMAAYTLFQWSLMVEAIGRDYLAQGADSVARGASGKGAGTEGAE